MSNCPSCGSPEVYNSGFSVECVNDRCQFFSPTHRKACWGGAAGFKAEVNQREMRSSTSSLIAMLRISSKTTRVLCDMCYMVDGSSLNFSRVVSDASLECHTSGNSFSASIEAVDQRDYHFIDIELRSAEGAIIFSRTVQFGPGERTFEINAD